MDWIIQKAVELGVAWVQPIVCERGVVRLSGERAARREAHWRRVAVAACEQSGRNRVPEIRPTIGFQSWPAVPATAPRWMLVPPATAIAAIPVPAGSLDLLVGPEGALPDPEPALPLTQRSLPPHLAPPPHPPPPPP